MTIEIFDDIIVDCNIVSAGVRGKQVRNNSRSVLFNGYAQININWTKTLRQYELGIVPMTRAQWQYIEALHEVTEGGAYGMLLVDPKDSGVTFATADGVVNGWYDGELYGEGGVGAGIPTYKLAKRYSVTNTTRYKDRYITRPVPTIGARQGNTTLVAGTGAGEFQVNYSTGDFTIRESASAYMASFTAGSTSVLTFGDGVFPALFLNGGVLWVNACTGTGASKFLQKPLPIVNVSGSNITVAVDSTGLTLTSALCFRYPQPTETLTWQGDFYVPVHFIDDSIDWELARGGDYDDRLVAGPLTVLLEVRE